MTTQEIGVRIKARVVSFPAASLESIEYFIGLGFEIEIEFRQMRIAARAVGQEHAVKNSVSRNAEAGIL